MKRDLEIEEALEATYQVLVAWDKTSIFGQEKLIEKIYKKKWGYLRSIRMRLWFKKKGGWGYLLGNGEGKVQSKWFSMMSVYALNNHNNFWDCWSDLVFRFELDSGRAGLYCRSNLLMLAISEVRRDHDEKQYLNYQYDPALWFKDAKALAEKAGPLALQLVIDSNWDLSLEEAGELAKSVQNS